MKKLLVIMAVILGVLIVGCSPMKNERDFTSTQIAKFQKTQPLPTLDFSNTRAAVIRRIVRWSDPNKLSYIYLVNYGRVMAFYPVKGSVESKRSYLSPAYGDSPDIDGTYGDNADSIFFFTTEDVYVEWHGDYMWVDQPLKLNTQPDLVYIAPLK